MHDAAGLAAPDAVFTSDAGNFATWPARFMEFADAQRFIGPTNGAMGYGVPAGIGAAIACPGRQVVVFVGDGGMLMTGQEIATASSTASPPSSWCSTTPCTAPSACTRSAPIPAASPAPRLTNPDFARFIEAFGGHGEVVSATAEFGPAFAARGRQRPPGADRAADRPGADHLPRHHHAAARRHRRREGGPHLTGPAGRLASRG